MPAISHNAPTGVALFFEEKKRGELKRCDFDHQVAQAMVLTAVEAVGELGPEIS
jgi:hypothetical protein